MRAAEHDSLAQPFVIRIVRNPNHCCGNRRDSCDSNGPHIGRDLGTWRPNTRSFECGRENAARGIGRGPRPRRVLRRAVDALASPRAVPTVEPDALSDG